MKRARTPASSPGWRADVGLGAVDGFAGVAAGAAEDVDLAQLCGVFGARDEPLQETAACGTAEVSQFGVALGGEQLDPLSEAELDADRL